jgi:hypothetical protein
MTDWQPIETAPKDGTSIDVWVREFSIGAGGALTVKEDGRVANAFWGLPRFYGEPPSQTHETWCVSDGMSDNNIEFCGRRATHWLPKPEAPKS